MQILLVLKPMPILHAHSVYVTTGSMFRIMRATDMYSMWSKGNNPCANIDELLLVAQLLSIALTMCSQSAKIEAAKTNMWNNRQRSGYNYAAQL